MWDFSVTEPFEYVWEYAGVQYLIGTVLVIQIHKLKKIRLARTARPQRAKMCFSYYISHHKTTV